MCPHVLCPHTHAVEGIPSATNHAPPYRVPTSTDAACSAWHVQATVGSAQLYATIACLEGGRDVQYPVHLVGCCHLLTACCSRCCTARVQAAHNLLHNGWWEGQSVVPFSWTCGSWVLYSCRASRLLFLLLGELVDEGFELLNGCWQGACWVS